MADLSLSYDALSTYLQFDLSHAASVNAKEEMQKSINLSNWHKIYNFVTSPMNIIDILAILPFYVELAVQSEDQSALVALRVLRVRCTTYVASISSV
jgi:hypothetical protein